MKTNKQIEKENIVSAYKALRAELDAHLADYPKWRESYLRIHTWQSNKIGMYGLCHIAKNKLDMKHLRSLWQDAEFAKLPKYKHKWVHTKAGYKSRYRWIDKQIARLEAEIDNDGRSEEK